MSTRSRWPALRSVGVRARCRRVNVAGSAATSDRVGLARPRLGIIQPAAQARTELVDVVARAHRLGFCRQRVATALAEASPRQLALIDEQIAADYAGIREELLDVESAHHRAARTLHWRSAVSIRYARQGNLSALLLAHPERGPR